MEILRKAVVQILPYGALLSFTASATAQHYLVKPGTQLSMRSGPGTEFARRGMLDAGTELEELERQGNWSKVLTPDGETVWVHNGYIDADPNADSIRNRIALVPPVGANQKIVSLALDEQTGRLAAYDGGRNVVVWNIDTATVFSQLNNVSQADSSITLAKLDGDIVTIFNGDEGRSERWSALTGKKRDQTEASWLPGLNAYGMEHRYAVEAAGDRWNPSPTDVVVRNGETGSELFSSKDRNSTTRRAQLLLSGDSRFLFRTYVGDIEYWDLDKVKASSRSGDGPRWHTRARRV